MRTALFGVLALVGGAEAAQAQQMPAYGYPNPNYYPTQGYAQPMMPGAPQQAPQQGYPQQAQPRVYYNNGTYGYYQGGAQPTQYYNNYPGNNSYPYNYYGTGNGAPYAYPQAQAPTYVYTPTARQYNQMYMMAPAVRTAPAASWPMPAAKATAVNVAETGVEPIDGGDGLFVAPKSGVSFHRPTKDLFWVEAGYEAAFFRSMGLATPLVTSGSQNDAAPGAFGQSSTQTLFGANSINFNLFSGVRLGAGVFLDENDRFSLEWTGTLFLPNYSNYAISSDGNGNPTIARPIFNVSSGLQGAFLNSLPGVLAGSINVDAKSQFATTEFNARMHGYFGQSFHVDGLFGFRYMQLNESLTMNERVNPLVPGFASFDGATIGPPDTLHDYDSFGTKNKFFGAQVGAHASYEYKCFTFESFFKLALGGTIEQTNIAGATTLVTPTGTTVAPGSILALPSNIGNYSRTVFGIVPEFGLNLGVDLCQNVRLKLGYSFLMWNHVVRPGNQLNPNVNPGQVPGSPAGTFANVTGPVSPVYRFNDELFWGHTFNLGVEFHY